MKVLLRFGMATCLLILPGLGSWGAAARDPDPGGARNAVEISVERFEELLEAARKKPEPEPEPEAPPPIDVSLDAASLQVDVKEEHANITATVLLRVLSEEWVQLPLLSTDSAIASITVDGKESALDEEEGKYVLHLRGRGNHTVNLTYSATVERLVGGSRLQFSMPRAVSGTLRATIPGTGWVTYVLPASGVESTSSGGLTVVSAVLRQTDRVQLLWGTRGPSGHVFTRANYELEVVGEGVFVDAEYEVEINADEPVDVPLVSASYALEEVTVDGEPARVVFAGDLHAVTLQGHGLRRLNASYALNVSRTDGQPAVELDVPPVPISRFDLTIPGKRDVSVDPVVPVVVEADDSSTKITAHFPKASHVRFGWTDSRPVPEQNIRMNGEGYYAVTAEEGGLRVAAQFQFDVISGKAREVSFHVPESVVVYQVVGDGVSDWRTFVDEERNERRLQVYLDQSRHGKLRLEVSYDSLLRKEDPRVQKGIPIPVIEPSPVHRYQGVILLLAGDALEFEPLQSGGLASVGEESLPPTVRSWLQAKVAHGFKYVGEAPELVVALQVPSKELARFDVRMNTLVTLDEGALRGQATADVSIKSGTLKELVFRLDPGISVLDVVAPALLKFTDSESGDRRIVTASFTEALEGTVRVGLTFERILVRELERLDFSGIEVDGADVQRGYLALDSSAAVEVETLEPASIPEIGVKELPRALVAATKNPILLAYKYSHVPFTLAIGVTQHEAIATIDSRILQASVHSTLQQQGNLVTKVEYVVANQSQQFLRVELPERAELWHVSVEGKTVKPAHDEKGWLIVPLPRSDTSFPVGFAFALKRSAFGSFGGLRLETPKPDLFIDQMTWDVALPDGYRYHRLRTNMNVQGKGVQETSASRLRLARSFIGPTDEVPHVRMQFVKKTGARGIDMVATLFAIALSVLLLRARRAPGRFERGLTLGLAMGTLAWVVYLGATPWTLLIPLLIAGAIAYVRSSGRTAET